MTVAGAARLDPETFAETHVGTYRPSETHTGHGCCQDAHRFGPLAQAQGRGAVSLIGFGSYAEGRSTLPVMAMNLRCRSWRCACCARRLRNRARARAFMGASGHKVALVTLTVDPNDPRVADPANRAGKNRPMSRDLVHHPQGATITESVRYVSWAWHRLAMNWRKRGTSRPYFRGLELQRSGMAHLHVLVRVKDAADFLRLRSELRGPETMRHRGLAVMAGFGKVVDVQLARSGGDVARYVTKMRGASDAAAYVTKALPDALPRYARRTAWAQTWAPGWVKPTPIAGFTWRVAKASTETVQAALAVSGDFHLVDPAMYRVMSSGPSPQGGL